MVIFMIIKKSNYAVTLPTEVDLSTTPCLECLGRPGGVGLDGCIGTLVVGLVNG